VALVDVVIVSYNSRERLRECVEPLASLQEVNVIVVDNASADGSLDIVADLPITRIPLTSNGGFAHGCNVGWRAGLAEFVLFLNPDARIEIDSLRRLVGVFEEDESVGLVAPGILGPDGSLDYSLRRFPRLRSTYAQAIFLHRVFPRSEWSDEVVRDASAYSRAGTPEWVSGACMLVRRTALEALEGFDERFFLYCEDADLCRRLWDIGSTVRFEPAAVARHEGGTSAPRSALLPVHARSRILYASKHFSRPRAFLDRLGVGLGAASHVVASQGGVAHRGGHLRSLKAALAPLER
jgi:N-acetylglucosaminyl-diphospho-decaprenol L-rhamnosyltransferase